MLDILTFCRGRVSESRLSILEVGVRRNSHRDTHIFPKPVPNAPDPSSVITALRLRWSQRELVLASSIPVFVAGSGAGSRTLSRFLGGLNPLFGCTIFVSALPQYYPMP